MTMAVLGLVVLGGLLLVVIGVMVGVRLASRGDSALGTLPAAEPVPPDRAGPAITGAPAITDEVLAALHGAGSDGDLTDEEIQRLLPGAKVVRHESTASSFTVQTPDGKTYERLEDIPDPRVREQIRRMLDRP